MSARLLACPACPFTSESEDAVLEHVGLDHPDVRPLSAHLGGCYEQTGLFEGAVTSWGATHGILLTQVDAPEQVRGLWTRICTDLHPLEGHFGPEGRAPRPRPQDRYLTVGVEHHGEAGRPCGDVEVIGLAWTQAPSPTTRAYGFGLFPECRRLGHGVCVKRALIARCFAAPAVHRVEAEVIGFNLWSLKVLHGLDDEMTEEGRLREAVRIEGRYYDRIFFGLLRPVWAAAQTSAVESSGNSAPPPATVRDMRPD